VSERAGVDHHTVTAEDAGVRLDRWFRRHLPTVPHSLLERWLRSGQVRVDGRRAEAAQRLQVGQIVRVPPHLDVERSRDAAAPPPDPRAAQALRNAVLYRDDDICVINKPSGLAVQGGTGTRRHVDGLLDGLRFGGERPRLVHRLDRDTSGVLVLARSARVAAELAEAFRRHEVAKLYWAIVVGGPRHDEGRIDLPLAKMPGPRGERVRTDAVAGDKAITDFRVLGRAGRLFAWLALSPLTGRTHQLRVHCASYGMPIFGDSKYGIAVAAPAEMDLGRGLHLHARALALPRGGGGEPLIVTAPPPPHMAASLRAFGFTEDRIATRDDWPGAVAAGRRQSRGLSRS
jgi:23S rRNA pseudouridine955/2504/2580 synthase